MLLDFVVVRMNDVIFGACYSCYEFVHVICVSCSCLWFFWFFILCFLVKVIVLLPFQLWRVCYYACLVLAFALYLMDVGVTSISFRRYLSKYALQHHLLLRFMSLSPLSFQFYSFYWICVFNCSLSWQVVWHQTLFSGWRDVGNLIKGICQL